MQNRNNKKEKEEEALINISYLQICLKELVENSICAYEGVEKNNPKNFYDKWKKEMINIIKNYENKRDKKNIKDKLKIVVKCLQLK